MKPLVKRVAVMLTVAFGALVSCSDDARPATDLAAPIADGGLLDTGSRALAGDATVGIDTGLGTSPGMVVADAGVPPIMNRASDGGGGSDAMSSPDAAFAPDASTVPVTCSGASSVRTGESSASIQFGGSARTYRVYVPANYKADVPAPLVLWFHGILGSSADYRSSGFQAVADREGFVLVAPEGIDKAWNIGPCCTARRRNVDDVGFAKAVVSELKQKACIDATRVYAAGFSMGGGMSHYLGCHAADVFAAVAPSAFDLLEENVADCKPARPISVASFRNSFDTFVYYDGVSDSQPPNTSTTGDTSVRINILGAVATLKAWAQINGCSGAPQEDGAGCQTYKTCLEGTEVTLCTEDDPIGGHHPGPADQMWAHLKRYRLNAH